jgi:hypothetical protein
MATEGASVAKRSAATMWSPNHGADIPIDKRPKLPTVRGATGRERWCLPPQGGDGVWQLQTLHQVHQVQQQGHRLQLRHQPPQSPQQQLPHGANARQYRTSAAEQSEQLELVYARSLSAGLAERPVEAGPSVGSSAQNGGGSATVFALPQFL